MCTKKRGGDFASPLFKIGGFLCYQKKVGNSAVTYFIGNSIYGGVAPKSGHFCLSWTFISFPLCVEIKVGLRVFWNIM